MLSFKHCSGPEDPKFKPPLNGYDSSKTNYACQKSLSSPVIHNRVWGHGSCGHGVGVIGYRSWLMGLGPWNRGH